MERTTIQTVAEWRAFVKANAIPETELVAGCGPVTRFNQAKKLGAVQELSEFSRKNRKSLDILMDDAMADEILGLEECTAKDRWDIRLGSGKNRAYYRYNRNQVNRKFNEAIIGSIRKGMLRDAVNDNFVYGPQANIDCYANCSNIQHRALLIKKLKSLGVENPHFWLSVDFGHHPALNSKYDRPKVHKLADDLFSSKLYFQPEFVRGLLADGKLEYIAEDFDWSGFANEMCYQTVTVLTNLYGRLYCAGFTASYHPGGSQAPADDEVCDMLDSIDMDGFQELLTRLHFAQKSDDGKNRFWVSQFKPPMIATAIVLASNANHEDKSNLSIDQSIVEQVLEALAATSDGGSEGFSLLVKDIVRKTRKGQTMTAKDKRIFAGLVLSIKAMLADEPLPENPVISDADYQKISKGKMGWPLFGGVDEPVEESKDE